MDITTMVHLHYRILLGCETLLKILPFVTAWVDLENTMLSEISQSEKDRYHMISVLSRI